MNGPFAKLTTQYKTAKLTTEYKIAKLTTEYKIVKLTTQDKVAKLTTHQYAKCQEGKRNWHWALNLTSKWPFWQNLFVNFSILSQICLELGNFSIVSQIFLELGNFVEQINSKGRQKCTWQTTLTRSDAIIWRWKMLNGRNTLFEIEVGNPLLFWINGWMKRPTYDHDHHHHHQLTWKFHLQELPIFGCQRAAHPGEDLRTNHMLIFSAKNHQFVFKCNKYVVGVIAYQDMFGKYKISMCFLAIFKPFFTLFKTPKSSVVFSLPSLTSSPPGMAKDQTFPPFFYWTLLLPR